MDVLVVRHGIAVDRDEAARDGIPDAERALTEKGRRRMKRVARGLSSLVPEVALLVSSPLIRAKQTAAVLGRAYGVPCTETRALDPDAAPEALFRFLAGHDGDGVACVVGHEPQLGQWVSVCLSGEERSAFEIGKGGACLLRFEGVPRAGRGRLAWLLPSGILRRL
jgi:phosphohistidine phosphatase